MQTFQMEPMFPDEGNKQLEDLTFELTSKAIALKSQVQPQVIKAIGDLVRSMNCYYSNLIEDHQTHPVDIENALRGDYSLSSEKRNLQLEATAHIEVQKMIEETIDNADILDIDYIKWIHKEFCTRLPLELRLVKDPLTGEEKEVIAGEFRNGSVIIGKHIPPEAQEIPYFLNRFKEIYSPYNLSKIKQIIAVPSSHHRFVWIHPFYDGNGRAARMLSHAYFLKIGIGSAMWSVSRGLARNIDSYKMLLMGADSQRLNDYDGRGNLSTKGLLDFCIFFLENCIDQVDFMTSLLEPKTLLNRIEEYVYNGIESGNLKRGSFELIREAYHMGKFERGKASIITGYSDRQARTVLTDLTKKQILVSETPKAPVTLNFPVEVVSKWFPKLYPENT